MLTNRSRMALVVMFALVLSTFAIGAVQAQPSVGSGPDSAMIPTGQWKELRVGDYHWYAFRFDYDEARADEPIEVRLYSEPFDSVVLTLRNEEQAELWRREGKEAHFGCCTVVADEKQEDGKKDYLLWSGALRSSGTYYIVVEPARTVTQPVKYRFELSGKGISFLAAPTGVGAVARTVAPPAALQERVLTSLTGTGPDYAMSPTTEWKELRKGQIHWYAFNFGYDEKREKPVIESRLYSSPNRGAILTVRNESQATTWRKDGKHEWFGQAMPADVDRDKNGEADYGLWAGTLRISGKYYIVVEHNKEFNQPVYYSFTLKGEGVSWAMTTAQPPLPAVVAPAAAPVVVEPAPRKADALLGTGPDYAMRPTDEWRTVQASEHQWFAFRFAYDEKRADQPVEIRVYSDPYDGAVLTVRNAEQAEKWRKDGVHEHFGCCTLSEQDVNNDGNPDFALWSGTLRLSGTYYIVVERAAHVSGPVHYHFTINGEGVSF